MVYILRLDRPFPGHERCLYYIGYARDTHTFFRRIKDHAKGRGAKFTRAAVRAGIGFRVVVIVPGATREDERRWKNWKKTHQVVQALTNKGYGAFL